MRKIVLLAVLAMVLVAVPAFASVQNIKVSGDISSTYVNRHQFDLGTVEAGASEQDFFITQVQLRVDADLTDKVSTTVQLLNERAWGLEDGNSSIADNDAEIDLDLAYVTIKEMLYSPLTVVVGRQAFGYGNSFIVDSRGPNNRVAEGGLDAVAEDLNKRSGKDAIRAILDYNPLTIDILYSKIDAGGLTGTGASDIDDKDDDIDLYGVNANFKLGDERDSVIEGYLWSRVNRSGLYNAGVHHEKTDVIYLPGVHVQTNLLDGLMVSAEAAMQLGTDTTSAGITAGDAAKRKASAWQLLSSYALPFEQTKAYSPVMQNTLTWTSGEENPGAPGRKNTAWDPFYENQAGGKIYNTLFDNTNCFTMATKGSFKPIEDLTASLELSNLWLVKQLNLTSGKDLTYTPGGFRQPDSNTSITSAAMYEDNKHLGSELDLGLSYAYTEDVTVGATLGWFMPGDFFAAGTDAGTQNGAQKTATQAMVNLDVKF